jgi:hypothetical protein
MSPRRGGAGTSVSQVLFCVAVGHDPREPAVIGASPEEKSEYEGGMDIGEGLKVLCSETGAADESSLAKATLIYS